MVAGLLVILLAFQTLGLSVHQGEHLGLKLSEHSQKASLASSDQDCQLCYVLSHWIYRPVSLPVLSSLEPGRTVEVFEPIQGFTSRPFYLPSVRAPPAAG